MKKFHLCISLIALLGTMIGSIALSQNIFFALVDQSLQAQLLRGFLSCLMLAQLLTSPPRHALLRLFTGMTALVVSVGAMTSLLTVASTSVVDTVILWHAAIALGITALEFESSTSDALRSPRTYA